VTRSSETTLVSTDVTRLKRPTLLVASITPLCEAGERIDEDAIGPLASFYADNGADGVFACGTTGEGLLLDADERLRVARRFREASDGVVIVNVGSQTTTATCSLAAQVAELGVDGVAAVPPPYYPLDAEMLTEHMSAVAHACAPIPFYMYVFTARSGYPFPVETIERIRDRAGNLRGLKVSEATLEAVVPYIETGLDVLVGQESLVQAAMRDGAVGAASGMASAFPAEVARMMRDETADGHKEMLSLRARLDRQGGMIPGLKLELGRLGLPVRPDVRAPLLSAAPAVA
jgi:dihydrodipicolinate synthase/N-acetylneuraminate lyase